MLKGHPSVFHVDGAGAQQGRLYIVIWSRTCSWSAMLLLVVAARRPHPPAHPGRDRGRGRPRAARRARCSTSRTTAPTSINGEVARDRTGVPRPDACATATSRSTSATTTTRSASASAPRSAPTWWADAAEGHRHAARRTALDRPADHRRPGLRRGRAVLRLRAARGDRRGVRRRARGRREGLGGAWSSPSCSWRRSSATASASRSAASSGPRLVRAPVLRNHPDRIEEAQAYLRRRGGRAVVMGRFTAFLRAVMPGLAGASRMEYRRFLFFNVIGGVLWGGACVLLGYFAAHSISTDHPRPRGDQWRDRGRSSPPAWSGPGTGACPR